MDGLWYSDNGYLYYLGKHMVELTQDQLPEDYEEDFEVMGRFRYCHAVFDRLVDIEDTLDVADGLSDRLCADLFEQQSPKFTPWDHEISDDFTFDRYNELYEYMENVLRDERNKDTNKFLITVKFGVVVDQSYEAFPDTGEVKIGFVPARKSSIEGLEKVSGLGECAICLEEGEGMKLEAKRMPCGHDFHVGCIEQWLETSHMCPLCRYAMPIHECPRYTGTNSEI